LNKKPLKEGEREKEKEKEKERHWFISLICFNQ
jgi:hypothetical protein